MTEYDRKTFPLRMVPGAVNLGWEFDVERRPEGLIGEDTPVAMKRKRTPMDKPLWEGDAA